MPKSVDVPNIIGEFRPHVKGIPATRHGLACANVTALHLGLITAQDRSLLCHSRVCHSCEGRNSESSDRVLAPAHSAAFRARPERSRTDSQDLGMGEVVAISKVATESSAFHPQGYALRLPSTGQDIFARAHGWGAIHVCGDITWPSPLPRRYSRSVSPAPGLSTAGG